MRVARLSITGFRGIPTLLTVDFRARPRETPRSLLLFGDNGTGKSSIVDGLEFGVRGRVSRLVLPRQEERRVIRSLTGGEPSVRVDFDSGEEVVRGNQLRSPKGTNLGLEPAEGFSLAPIVIRRSDILRFWEVPANQRQLVFFEYFRGPGWGNRDVHRKVSLAEQALLVAEADRETAVTALVSAAHVGRSRIPADNVELDAWTRKDLGPKFGQRVDRGGRSFYRLPREIREPLRLVSGANRRLKQARTALGVAQQASAKPDRTPGGALVREILSSASAELSDAFTRISAAPHIREIRLQLGLEDQVSLDVVVHLSNETTAAAKDVLSEANLDLLALLVFTSVAAACAEHGQERLLIFDDVFQSVDSAYRTAVVGFLLERFAEWQLVFTVHDRLWFARLAEMFRQHNHRVLQRRIVRWTLDEGPVLRDAVLEPGAELRRALETGELVPIVAAAGILLEQIADRLSWTIGSGVTRRYGDLYTLGDLWPGVSKHLKKSSVKDMVDRVTELLQLRNLLGAHYNEWAQSLTDKEARDFGEAVQSLLAAVQCETCGGWILPSADGKPPWRCGCGETTVEAV